MSYSAPSSVTTGDLITAATWNQDIVDNVIAIKAQVDGIAPVLTNGSGATRSAGDVIIYSTGADEEFTTTTTVGDAKVIGVVKDATIANAASGEVALAGTVNDVLCTTGAVARGDFLQSSATAGQAQAGAGGAFAIALEAKGAGSTGLVSAVIIHPNSVALEMVISLMATPTGLVAMDTTTIFDESRVSITPDHLLNAREIYFEIRAKRTSANGLLVGARLVLGTTVLSILQTSSTAYVALRSGNLISLLPSGASDTVLYVNNYCQNDNGLLAYARVVVVR